MLSVIARLGAARWCCPVSISAWTRIRGRDQRAEPQPTILGHPQYGLAKLLRALRATRDGVEEIGELAPAMSARRACVSEALRPAETTDAWATGRDLRAEAVSTALADVTLIEAANERDEAAAIAIALRQAAADPEAKVALVTPDRNLARRVSTELLRFNVVADDSGGTLSRTARPNC